VQFTFDNVASHRQSSCIALALQGGAEASLLAVPEWRGPWIGAKFPAASGFGSFGAHAWVNSGLEEILMAAISQDVHRRRVMEHQAKIEADRSTPVPHHQTHSSRSG
jgi:hypothetical protein